MENSNEKKYDISKSNFFANIPEKDENEPKNEIKDNSFQLISTPMSNMNPQIPQSNFSNLNIINNNNNINNINNINNNYNNPSYATSNFLSSQNFYPQYQPGNQYPNQPLNY